MPCLSQLPVPRIARVRWGPTFSANMSHRSEPRSSMCGRRRPVHASYGSVISHAQIGGACSSCPPNRHGSSNLAQRTRQAGPSKARTRQAGPSEGEIGGACSSCPQNGDGLSNGVHWTRQAGPSEAPTRQAGPSEAPTRQSHPCEWWRGG
jgi:Fe-S cluster biogenesis protein NfuA